MGSIVHFTTPLTKMKTRSLTLTLAFALLTFLLAFSPVPPPTDLSGKYQVMGGSGYTGTLTVVSEGESRYHVKWLIGNGETYQGAALQAVDVLVVGWDSGTADGLAAGFLTPNDGNCTGNIRTPDGKVGTLTIKGLDTQQPTAGSYQYVADAVGQAKVSGTVTVEQIGEVFYLTFQSNKKSKQMLWAPGLPFEGGLALAMTDNPGPAAMWPETCTPPDDDQHGPSPTPPAIEFEPGQPLFTRHNFGLVVYKFSGKKAAGIWCMSVGSGIYTEDLSK